MFWIGMTMLSSGLGLYYAMKFKSAQKENVYLYNVASRSIEKNVKYRKELGISTGDDKLDVQDVINEIDREVGG